MSVETYSVTDMRDFRIREMIKQGFDLDIIAKRFDCSYSHVKALWRALQDDRS